MNTLVKRIGLVLGGLVALLAIVAVGLFFNGRNRMSNAREIAVKTVDVANGDAVHGEHLAKHVAGCIGCHGKSFEGEIMIDDPAIGVVPAPNLTSSTLANYSDEDWARAIRHGIGGDGRVMGAMPSANYQHMSDSDLADLIAYMKTVPEVENSWDARQLSFTGNIIFGNLAWSTLPVNVIDHDNVGSNVSVGVSAEYGEYLSYVGACRECHGEALDGVVADPNAPQGPPLSSVSGWTQEQFITAIRTGMTPSGSMMSDVMPWEYYSGQTDDELTALWVYLDTLGE